MSVELTLILDSSDHDTDLNDRNESELRDPLFDAKYIATIPIPLTRMRSTPGTRLPTRAAVRKTLCLPSRSQRIPRRRGAPVIDEECTESQQDFFFEHFGKGTPLEEMRQAEAEQTGKLPSSAAMTNRKNKIIDKVAKSFGVERVKRHKYPKKD